MLSESRRTTDQECGNEADEPCLIEVHPKCREEVIPQKFERKCAKYCSDKCDDIPTILRKYLFYIVHPKLPFFLLIKIDQSTIMITRINEWKVSEIWMSMVYLRLPLNA